MLRFFAVLIFVSFSQPVFAENIPEFLNRVVDAYNAQDCVAYSSYYSEPNRQKKRKEMGLFFASNDATITLKESHVLSEEESAAEVAVAFSCRTPDQSRECVSRVYLVKEDGSWKIDKELRLKKDDDNEDPQMNVNHRSNSNSNPNISNSTTQVYTSNPFTGRSLASANSTTQNCPSGTCGGPRVPFSSLKACRDYGFDPIPCRNGSCSIK